MSEPDQVQIEDYFGKSRNNSFQMSNGGTNRRERIWRMQLVNHLIRRETARMMSKVLCAHGKPERVCLHGKIQPSLFRCF